MLDKSNKPYFSIDQRIRQDLLILLTVNDQFREDIRSLRKGVGIPEEGFGTQYTVTAERKGVRYVYFTCVDFLANDAPVRITTIMKPAPINSNAVGFPKILPPTPCSSDLMPS